MCARMPSGVGTTLPEHATRAAMGCTGASQTSSRASASNQHGATGTTAIRNRARGAWLGPSRPCKNSGARSGARQDGGGSSAGTTSMARYACSAWGVAPAQGGRPILGMDGAQACHWRGGARNAHGRVPPGRGRLRPSNQADLPAAASPARGPAFPPLHHHDTSRRNPFPASPSLSRATHRPLAEARRG